MAKQKYIVLRNVGGHKKGDTVEFDTVPVGLSAHLEPADSDAKVSGEAALKKEVSALKAENAKLKKELEAAAQGQLEVATPADKK